MEISVQRSQKAPTHCIYCHGGFEGEASRRCVSCQSRYHLDCAEDCMILGCAGPLEGRAASRRQIRVVAEGGRLRFDVSGRRGADGPDGSRGRDGRGTAGRGRDGGDAGPAYPGQDAGVIELGLSEDDGSVSLSGWQSLPGGGRQSIDQAMNPGAEGAIELIARGGDGGDGGDGGRGGNGARGGRGSNATRYSSGSSGGRGGRGGDGGRGSDGGNGGRGGRVEVTVSERETHLLMLIARVEVGGGQGGQAGSHGSGGSGGPGGAGGSSYSWTETESYTDSQGNRQTRTRYRSNSGGSTGPRGMGGHSGSGPLHHGADGVDGRISYAVRGAEGLERYSSRYEMRLRGLAHHSADQDGVYEPRERVIVERVRVQNVGAMPSPGHHDIEVSVAPGDWVEPEGEALTLPRGLAGGDVHLCEGQLSFRIGDYVSTEPGAPFGHSIVIPLQARLPAIRRGFEDFEDERAEELARIRIAFPIRASELDGLLTLAPGEATRLRWELSNVARSALGRESPGGRVLSTRLIVNDNGIGEGLALYDKDEAPRSLEDGVSRDVAAIAAEEAFSDEALVAVSSEAPAPSRAVLWLELSLSYPDAPEEVRVIQIRAHELQVSPRYRSRGDADLLWVVHHRSRPEAMAAIEETAAAFGLSAALWNLSLENHLGLERSLSAGGSLAADFAGRPIVITNQLITAGEGLVSADAFLSQTELREAMWAGGSFVFLGLGRALTRLLIPSRALSADNLAADKASFEEGLESTWFKAASEAPKADWGLDCVTRWRILGKPEAGELKSRARKLARRLRARAPGRRVFVIYDFEPRRLKRWGLFERWSLGQIWLREGPPTRSGALVHAPCEDAELQFGNFTMATRFALLLSLSFSILVQRLSAALRGEDESELLERAVQRRLDDELENLLALRWRSGLSGERAAASLPRLEALMKGLTGVKGAPVSSERGEAVLVFLACLWSLYGRQVRWWEWIPPFLFLRRRQILRRAGRAKLRAGITAIFGEGEQGKAALKSCRARAASFSGSRGRRLWEEVSDPYPDVESDGRALVSVEERMVSARRLAKLREEVEKEDRERAALVQAGAARREELLYPKGAEELGS